MFKDKYQGGPYFEVFSPQQKDTLSQWKMSGQISKNYDKEIKSFSYTLEGSTATTKIQIPKDPRMSLHLVQRYLVVQIALRKGADFSMELGMSDMKNGKRRLMLSTTQKDIHITPLHAKIPLKIIKVGMWLNLCLDLVSMIGETWKGETYKLLDSITISANCLIRRIFTMKSQPPDTVGDDELYGCSPSNVGELDQIPKQCQFASEFNHLTQLLTIDKIKHAERLRGGGDMRGSINSNLDLDLSGSGRRSSTQSGDNFHIAFGSKISGVRTSQTSSKKTSRDTVGNLTNRSIRSNSRAEDGVTSSGYQDMSVSRDSLYTGRDPGGGSREMGSGGGASGISKKDGTQLVPNPPGKPASVRLGHQRQYSDPFTVIDKDSSTKNAHGEVSVVQPHPPREPSHERVRRRPARFKSNSAGKDRISNTSSQKDEGIGTSASSVLSNQHSPYNEHRCMRVVSDGDLLDVSGSSTDSGPRQKSAEHVKRPPVDVHRKNKPPQRKEYRAANYQQEGVEMDELSDLIELLPKDIQYAMNHTGSSDEEIEDDVEGDSEEEDRDDMYLFVSQPKPAPRQKNASPSYHLLDNVDKNVKKTAPKGRKKEGSKARGPRPEEDFINDDSSDSDDKLRGLNRQGSRPNSGSRPGSGTRPNSGTRPGSGTRPSSGSRPDSGNRPLRPTSANRSHSRTNSGSRAVNHIPPSSYAENHYEYSNKKTNGATNTNNGNLDSVRLENGIPIPRLSGLPNGTDDGGGSPTSSKGITDRSFVSRMSKTKLKEIPMTDARISHTNAENKAYDFSKYAYQDLTASDEEEMLAAIQGARSAEFEPENFIDTNKSNQNAIKSLQRTESIGGAEILSEMVAPKIELKVRKSGPQVGRTSRETNNDSPTFFSEEDDTSLSTWKPPPQKPHDYRPEMQIRLSSDTFTDPREWSGVCSPPVLHGMPVSNSLDDISTLSNNSPRKPVLGAGESPKTTDDEEELDLLYDSQLNCYYDPKTCTYYELS